MRSARAIVLAVLALAGAAATPASAQDPAAATPAPAATPGPPAAQRPPEGVNDGAIAAAAKEGDGSASVPKTLVALAVIGALVLLGVLGWTIARWMAFDPRWLQRWRHAGREASYRASGAWTDFADWVRIGR